MKGTGMKKTLLFLVIFFLFPMLTAETAKDRKFYFEPALGIKTGLPVIFGTVLDMNFDFLVYRTEKMHNIYLGLDLGFKYSPWGNSVDNHSSKNALEFPFKANISFDFKRYGPHVDYMTLRLSGGIDLLLEQDEIYEDYKGVYRYSDLKLYAAWEIELNIVFKNNVVMKFAFDSSGGFYPEPVIGLGYRF